MVRCNPLSLDPSIKGWLKGLEHTKSIPRIITPTWCLELVLATLGREPFEPVMMCRLKYLTWKTVLADHDLRPQSLGVARPMLQTSIHMVYPCRGHPIHKGRVSPYGRHQC